MYGKSVVEMIEPLQIEYAWLITLLSKRMAGDPRATIVYHLMQDFR